jgi:hypothetical protein
MSTLAKLKLISSKRQRTTNPVLVRRHKLASRIHEQIELAKAQIEGRSYSPTRLRSYKNVDTGERRTIEVPKRLREWYWTAENGKINLSIRYGAKVIELAKDRNAIEVRNLQELLDVLTLVKQAALNGELDEAILIASETLRDGFIQ